MSNTETVGAYGSVTATTPSHPSLHTIVGGLADAIVSELDTAAVKSAIEAEIGTDEKKVEGIIASTLKSLPKPGGVLALAMPALDGAINAYAAKLVSDYGPGVIYAFVEAEALALAKTLGG